jgi:signal transduction histidine kinase
MLEARPGSRLAEMVTTGTSPERTVPITVITGLTLAALASFALLHNIRHMFPYQSWTTADIGIWSAAVASCVVMSLAGPWLVWRLPTNPTGWWVAGSGAAISLWVWGSFTWTAVSPWFEYLLPPVYKAAIVVAVLQWPTGRLPARWATPLRGAVICYIAVSWLPHFVGPPIWPTMLRALPSVGDLVTNVLVATVVGVLVSGVAPALFMGAVHRRRAAMPRGVRVTTAPAYAAALLLVVSEVWAFVSDLTSGPLSSGTGRAGSVGGIGLFVELARFGVVAVLLVWSEATRRSRASSAPVSSSQIELGGDRPVDVTADVAHILGDPTAELELVVGAPPSVNGDRSSDRRVGGSRARLGIADRHGTTIASVDHQADCVVDRTTRDALMASIGLAVVRSARQQAAERELAKLRDVQGRVLDAQDRARRRLERDLHDGVQQRLVALALDASLLERRSARQGLTFDDREQLRATITATIEAMRETIHAATPGVLDHGLAAGLVALDATIPISTTTPRPSPCGSWHPKRSPTA